MEFVFNVLKAFSVFTLRVHPIYSFWNCAGSDGGGSRSVNLGDREEEQLLSRQGVRARQRQRPVQQGEQQPLQSQLLQALRYLFISREKYKKQKIHRKHQMSDLKFKNLN